jgi:arginyl-tRNA synthetase
VPNCDERDEGLRRLGSDAELARDPIRHLFDVYVATNKAAETDPAVHTDAREAFCRLEQGEAEQV